MLNAFKEYMNKEAKPDELTVAKAVGAVVAAPLAAASAIASVPSAIMNRVTVPAPEPTRRKAKPMKRS